MNLADARTECQRWLDHLERQKERSVAIQKIAAERRTGKIDHAEGQRRLRAIDNCSVTVFDGARLAEAVTFLLKYTKAHS